MLYKIKNVLIVANNLRVEIIGDIYFSSNNTEWEFHVQSFGR